MANRNQLSYGSQGSDVTELQKLLNQNGYKLDTDGIFGKQTQEAVKQYQQKNGLSVDGIVGNNTWGALTKASTGTSAKQPAATNTGFQYNAYQESDAVKQAQAMLNQQLSQKPGQYQSPWQAQLNDIMNQILNREKFSYDLNGDALYQQYKDKYISQGRMAMMDTMGQAAALTGGYGNSYAQSVGQQAYNGYLQQLNDKVPELYQLALDQYTREGQDMYNQFSMLGAMEDQEYGRYRDSVSDWRTEVDRLQSGYNAERDYDYSKWSDDRNFGYSQYVDDRNYQYQLGRDQVADSQWQAEFDEAMRRWNFENKVGEYAPAAGSGGSGSGNGWLNKDGTVNVDLINKSSDWWQAYAASKGLDPDTGLYLDGTPGTGPEGTPVPDSLNAYIDDVVRGTDKDGNNMSTYGANKGTVDGQNAVKKAESEALNAAVAAGEITAQQAAERKRAQRGYTR